MRQASANTIEMKRLCIERVKETSSKTSLSEKVRTEERTVPRISRKLGLGSPYFSYLKIER